MFDSVWFVAVDVMQVVGEATRVLRSLDVSVLPYASRVGLMHALADLADVVDVVKTRVALVDRDDLSVSDGVDGQLVGGRVSGRDARRVHRRLDVAEALPTVAAAFDEGAVPAAAVDVIASALGRCDDDQREALVELQSEIVEAAAGLPVEVFRRRLSDLVRAVTPDRGVHELQTQIEASSLEQWIDPDSGMGITKLTLDPIRHEELSTQIRRELDRIVQTDKLDYTANTRAAALLSLINPGGTAGVRPEVVVIVDADTIRTGPHDESVCETMDGVPVPPSVLDRYLCDADLSAVVRQPDGTIDRISKTHRVATSNQRRILAARYRTCAHDGCDVPFSACQIHHLAEWDGSNTTLDNLLPLCSRHHHGVHDHGWSHELLPDRTVIIRRPDGQTHRAGQPPDRRPQPHKPETREPIVDPPRLWPVTHENTSTATAVPPARAA